MNADVSPIISQLFCLGSKTNEASQNKNSLLLVIFQHFTLYDHNSNILKKNFFDVTPIDSIINTKYTW